MNWRKTIIAIAVVLGVVVVIPIFLHYRLRATTEAYLVKLRAQGEPMDLAQVLPPPTPPEQNSAPIFSQATALFSTNQNVLSSNPPLAMRMIAPGKAMVGWKQSDIRTGRTSNSWSEVEAALAKEDAALTLLRQIPELPAFDFKIQYDGGFGKIRFQHLAPLKSAALKLSAATLCDARRGHSAAAVKNIHTMLSLVEGMGYDRMVISELVRIAIAQIAFDANWAILQSPDVTDEQLTGLQQAWAGLEFFHAEENALAMERAMGQITVAEWRSSNAALLRYFNVWEEFAPAEHKPAAFTKLKTSAKLFLWRYWWSYPDELRTAKGEQALLETLRFARTNSSLLIALRQQDEKLRGILITNSDGLVWFGDPDKGDMHNILSESVLTLSRVFNKVMKVEAARQLTITTIALKRFQLKHGNLPEKLSELTPEFLADAPHDPVDGQPLRYRRNADGTFLLYSIGDDGVDDGGDPQPPGDSKSRSWQNGRDWVWPQPASESEIQAYYRDSASQ